MYTWTDRVFVTIVAPDHNKDTALVDEIGGSGGTLTAQTRESKLTAYKLVETGVDVGPVIYLARTFQTDIDTVVKFFIFVLIFVFDPMAVMFVISYNVALDHID